MAKHIRKKCIRELKGILKYNQPYTARSMYLDMISECIRDGKACREEDIVQFDRFENTWLPTEDWLEYYYDVYLKDHYYRRTDGPEIGKSALGLLADKISKKGFCIGGRGICPK